MKNLFVPYRLAIIAKEKGFNEQCLAWYRAYNFKPDIHYSLYPENSRTNSRFIKGDGFTYATAPIYQQLLDWFREVHKLIISVDIVGDDKDYPKYYPVIYKEEKDGKTDYMLEELKSNYKDVIKNSFNDYYTALNTALEKAFKLI